MYPNADRADAASSPSRLGMLVRWTRAPFEWAGFYFCLSLLGATQLAWALAAFCLRHLLSPEVGRRVGRRVISHVFRNFFRLTGVLGLLKVDATALDAIDQDEAMVIAPNHPTVLDALILISRLDRLTCIMKASVLDNVLLGASARLAGYIRNDGPKRMLRLAFADLRRGDQLIIFPEGTRTVSAPVNAFKYGFAAIAMKARVPVQAIIIETDTPYLTKGWPVLRKPARLPMRFHVRLGERFEVGDDVNGFVDSLRAYFIRELAEPVRDGVRPAPDARRSLPPMPRGASTFDGPSGPVAIPKSIHASRRKPVALRDRRPQR